jgi:hypothetical protein
VNEASFLEATAEVAVAFAGFIGVVLVLASRDGRFPVRDSLQIRVILVAGVTPIFYSAVPLLLHYLAVPIDIVWRVSSGVAGLAGLAITAFLIPQLLAAPPAERPPLTSPNSLTAWALTALALVCHFANAVGWPWTPSGGLYLLGVWFVLAVAGTNFVALIFRRVL